MKAREEAEFARTEAETSKEKDEEAAYNLGVVETQAFLKSQVPEVCRLYCSQVWNEALKQAGVEASSDLWKVESVYYPPTIMEFTPSSSEAEVAPEEAKVARPEAALVMTTPDKPAEEGEVSGATETSESLNSKEPQKTIESIADPQALQAKESALLVEPHQAVHPEAIPTS